MFPFPESRKRVLTVSAVLIVCKGGLPWLGLAPIQPWLGLARVGQRDFRSESSYRVVHTLFVPTRGACRCADCVWLFCLRWVIVSPPSLCLAAFSPTSDALLDFSPCIVRVSFRLCVCFSPRFCVVWFGLVWVWFGCACFVLVLCFVLFLVEKT